MLSNIGCGKTRSNFAVICLFVDSINPSGVTVGPAHCGIVFSVTGPLDLPEDMLLATNSSVTHNTSVIFAKKEVSSHQLSFVICLGTPFLDCILLSIKWADTLACFRRATV